MTRAVLAQAPGSVDGRLKLTEQGEVIADRYANPQIALRHLEQLTYAALVASAPQHDEMARPGARRMAPMPRRARGDRARRISRPGVGRPMLRGLFPCRDADRRADRPGHRLAASGPPAARRRGGASPTPRLAARHPVGLRVVPVARQPARLVRHGHGAAELSASGTAMPASRELRGSTARGRSSPASSTTPR